MNQILSCFVIVMYGIHTGMKNVHCKTLASLKNSNIVLFQGDDKSAATLSLQRTTRDEFYLETVRSPDLLPTDLNMITQMPLDHDNDLFKNFFLKKKIIIRPVWILVTVHS